MDAHTWSRLHVAAIAAAVLALGMPPGAEASDQTVTTTSDGTGAGTIRAALAAAGTGDTILFALPGPAYTFTPSTAFPALANGVVLDGASQPNHIVPVIDGSGLPAGTDAFSVGSNDTLIGLAFTKAPGDGVQANGSGNAFIGNRFFANGGAGLHLAGAGGDTVGGADASARNFLFGNGGPGILGDATAVSEHIDGNFIGTNVAGNAAMPNAIGIQLAGQNSAIGLNAGNVISGNTGAGAVLKGNAIQLLNNTIGANALRTGVLPNGGPGVTVFGSNILIGPASGTAQSNVILGNGGDGILFSGPGAFGGQVRNNGIGAVPPFFSGFVAPNAGDGVRFEGGAVNDAVFNNAIDWGDGAGIFLGPNHQVDASSNAFRGTGLFVIDGGTRNVLDGNGVPSPGTVNGANVPFTFANHSPNADVFLFGADAACNGPLIVVRPDAKAFDSRQADATGGGSGTLSFSNPFAAGHFPIITAFDQGGSHPGSAEQPNTCRLPAPGGGTPGGGDVNGTPSDQTGASSTIPLSFEPTLPPAVQGTVPRFIDPFVGPLAPSGTPSAIFLDLVGAPTGPTLYQVEAVSQFNARFRWADAAKKLPAGTFALKRVTVTLAPNQRKKVRIPFTKAAKRYIARHHVRRARVTFKITERLGTSSQAFTKALTVKLKSAKKRH